MKLPPADIGYLAEQFEELCSPLLEAWDESESPEKGTSLPLLCKAMRQLIAVMRQLELGTDDLNHQTDPLDNHELHTLGEYGVQLLSEIADWARHLHRTAQAEALEQLSLPLALWVARRGGELTALEPVVNCLAQLANHLQTPNELARLYGLIDEVLEAVNPAISQRYEHSHEAGNPWRLLLLNRAIVATRSHIPRLMEPAFDTVVELLPADSERFFAEAMEQMEIIDYPEHVRELVKSYYMRHAQGRTLH